VPATINTFPLDRMIGQLVEFDSIDFEPLMMEFEAILKEDNDAAVMAGIDGFDMPLIPVTYRPDPKAGTGKVRTPSTRPYNNLSTTAYKMLGGPPLAPRGMDSRIATNFRTGYVQLESEKAWLVLWAWEDVVSVDDIAFLGFHFRGEGNLPVRNLAHLRPSTYRRCKAALHDFTVRLISRIRGRS
jgi:hypothetical protein